MLAMSRTPDLQPRPESGVCTGSPDGAYFWREGDKAQIIIVGPMRFAPIEYQCAFIDLTSDDWWISGLEFMTAVDPQFNHFMLQRGFVNIQLQRGERPKAPLRVVE